jgi:hypothetical protein
MTSTAIFQELVETRSAPEAPQDVRHPVRILNASPIDQQSELQVITNTRDQSYRLRPGPLDLPSLHAERPRSWTQIKQQWEGTVLENDETIILASLRIIGGDERLRAEIPFEEVPDADHPLVVPGAVFYWSIGYQVEPTGQKTSISDIRFRRVPAWRESDIARLRKAGEELHAALVDEG